MNSAISPGDITLGILAGGRATRLGGVDKAWIEREGVAQVLRWQQRFADETGAVLVSANRDPARYTQAGLQVVADATRVDIGPIAGLEALLRCCRTRWLFTLPVDLVGVNDCLLPTLCAGRGDSGAFARDDDGDQPLVALWRTETALPVVASAMERDEAAIHALQAALRIPAVRFAGVRFGNLNTPEDLRVAGIRHD